jgi:DNA-binding transcriptional regulator YdaS (Cro superfamily)
MDLKKYISSQRGRAKALAAEIGISPSFLSQIAAGTAPASPSRCLEIEKATDGQVARQDLRKNDWRDIWPELATDDRYCAADPTSASAHGQPASSPNPPPATVTADKPAKEVA